MKVSTLLILISLITIATLTNAQVATLADLGCPCNESIVDRGEFMRCVNSKTKELKQTYDKRAYKRLRKQFKKKAAKCEFGKEETSEDGGDQTTLDSGDGDSDDGEKKDCTTITKVNQCDKVGGGMCSFVSGICIDNPNFMKGGGGTSSNGGGQGGNGGGGGNMNAGGGGNMNDGGGSNNSKPNGQGGNNMGNKPVKPKENGDSNPMNTDGGESKPNMNNVGGNGNGQNGGKPMITGGTNEGGGGSNTKPNGQVNKPTKVNPMNGGGNTKPNGGKPPWAGQGDSEDGEDTETTEDSEDTETSEDGVSSGADGDGGQQKDCSLITNPNQCNNKWGGACSWIGGTCVGNTVAVSKQTSLQEADGTIPQPLNSSIKVKGKFSSLIFYAAAMMFYQA